MENMGACKEWTGVLRSNAHWSWAALQAKVPVLILSPTRAPEGGL